MRLFGSGRHYSSTWGHVKIDLCAAHSDLIDAICLCIRAVDTDLIIPLLVANFRSWSSQAYGKRAADEAITHGINIVAGAMKQEKCSTDADTCVNTGVAVK